MRHRGIVAVAVLCASAAWTSVSRSDVAQTSPPMNTLTDQERADGWRLLFDGRTTTGWRGFRKAEMPAGWQVVDGALSRVEAAGDIVTVEQFESFDLAFDWKIAPGGNSGVFFNVTEDAEAVWHSGPEYQILDDAAHQDGLKPETSAGSDYALHAPARAAARPPGTWNVGRIVVKGPHVEHWLNGEKIVEYELGSADWVERVRNSKFNEFPDFGRASKGHIAIQDHGDAVAYRNIKIRPL